jgi:acetyl esterase/lipase
MNGLPRAEHRASLTARTPPTFLVHAYDDPLNPVAYSLLYAAALRWSGVPAEIHVYAKGGHAFALRRTASSTTAWPQLAKAWLEVIGVIGQQSTISHAR